MLSLDVSKSDDKNAEQVVKVDNGTAVRILASLRDIRRVGSSLGSFCFRGDPTLSLVRGV